jgi:hypothetical protein
MTIAGDIFLLNNNTESKVRALSPGAVMNRRTSASPPRQLHNLKVIGPIPENQVKALAIPPWQSPTPLHVTRRWPRFWQAQKGRYRPGRPADRRPRASSRARQRSATPWPRAANRKTLARVRCRERRSVRLMRRSGHLRISRRYIKMFGVNQPVRSPRRLREPKLNPARHPANYQFGARFLAALTAAMRRTGFRICRRPRAARNYIASGCNTDVVRNTTEVRLAHDEMCRSRGHRRPGCLTGVRAAHDENGSLDVLRDAYAPAATAAGARSRRHHEPARARIRIETISVTPTPIGTPAPRWLS